MRAWIRLGLAGVVIIAAVIGIRMAGEQTILLENVEARSHGGAMIGVTLTVRNDGPPDLLMSVEVPGSKLALIMAEHTGPLPMPAYSSIDLASDGAHIMIGGLDGVLQDGRLIPLTLMFENAGRVAAKARFSDLENTDTTMDHGAMGGAEYIVPDGEAAPDLSVSAQPNAEGGFSVTVEIENFRFSREQADGPHEAGTGHGHLYAGGVKIGRVYGKTAVIPPLPDGPHIIRVTLNTNDHRIYVVNGEPVTASVKVGE